MSETKTTNYVGRLVAVVTWYERLSVLDEEQIEAMSNEDLVADLGEAVTSHVPWLLGEVRAASAVLAEAGVQNGGAPLDERVKMLRNERDVARAINKQVQGVADALTTAGYPPLKGFSMVEAIHEMVKRITYLEGANIDATTVNDATEDALRAQVTALEADRSRFTGSHEQVVAVLNKYAVPPGDTVAARLEAVLGAANICRVCDRPRADHGGEDNGVDDGRVCDGFEPKEGTVSFAYRIRAGDRGGDGLVLQVDERDLPPVQAGDTGPITVVRLPVVPPSVQAGLDGLYLRREALDEQIDAHDTAEPPTAPPVELVREYQAVREEIATVEKAARGKPRVPVQPVAATNVTESMAFVDGPGYHGVASVPVHTYPESPQGRACFDFRKKHDVFVFHVARALRLSPADVAGLERGALTTDEEGWEEVWAALGLLALTHPDRRREEATRLAAREISTLRTLLAVGEEANATLLAALARGSAEPAGGGS